MERLPRLEDVPPAPREFSEESRAAATGRPGIQAPLPRDSLFVLLTSGLLVLAFCWGLPVDLVIALAAEGTRGTVVSVEQRRDKQGEVSSGTVQFRYEAGGSTWLGEGNSRRTRAPDDAAEAFVRLAPGVEIAVEYSVLVPGWARLPGGTYARFGYLGVPLLLIPIGAGWSYLRAVGRLRRLRRLLSRGRPVLARVTSSGPGNDLRFPIAWEFEAAGRTYQGATTLDRPLYAGVLREAQEVVVLHDPADPRRNALYVP